jgi:drug/metabolite transporter (DMT)-like permease
MPQSTTPNEGTVLGNPNLLGSLAVLLATAFWGTSALFIKLILASGEISPLALAFWRDLVTFLVLLVGLRLLRPAWLHVKRSHLIWFAALGASIGTLHLLWNVVVLLNGAAVATVQQAATPAIVAVAAWLVWREPVTGRKVLAIFLTFVGTVFVSGLTVRATANLSPTGLLMGLALPVIYAGWNMVVKQVRRGHNPFTTLTYGFGFSTLILLPFQFFARQPQSVSASTVLFFLGLVGIGTMGGFSIYTFALGRLEASVATILAMAELPIAVGYAYILLGERLAADQIVGAALVAAGVLWLSWRHREQSPLT